jgi:hypothetical protein
MRILHILDHSLPLHSGYTFRTRAIMRAQIALGWDVVGITGVRQGAGAGVETVDGLTFHRTPPVGRLPGPLSELNEVRGLVRWQAISSPTCCTHIRRCWARWRDCALPGGTTCR